MINQKAREIAERAFDSTASYPEKRFQAARLGIIEGVKMAAKVAETLELHWYPEDEVVGEITAEKIAAAILALIEEQK